MKKILALLAVSLLALISSGLFVACGEVPETNQQTVAPVANFKISHSGYLDDTEPVQAFQEIYENGKIVEYKAELTLAQTVNGIRFLQYRIGEIRNCFIQNITRPTYNDGGINTIRYTTGKLTSHTISEGVANSISTTESISLSHSQATRISWEIQASASRKTSASAGIQVGILNAGASVSQSFSLAAKYGQTNETVDSKTVAKETTDAMCRNLDVTALIQDCEEITYEFDLSRYELGYYYVLALVADIDVYQIIAYNENTHEFYSTYFITEISENNTAMRILSSKSASFNIPPEYQLSPITDISYDALFGDEGTTLSDSSETPEPETYENTVLVDMSNCYEYNKASLNNIDHPYYDAATHIFTAYGSYDGLPVTRYLFKGWYGLPDLRGRIIRDNLENFSIEIFSEHDITIEFENMSFTSIPGLPALYKSKDVENNKIDITIISSGIGNYIYGSDGVTHGTDGDIAVNLDGSNLTITGNAPIEIYGGNGKSGAAGIKGVVGTIGIRKTNSKAGNGGNGTNGGNGENGGNGSVAILSDTILFKKARVKLYGGNGADGGCGADGGMGGKGGTCVANAGGAHGGAGQGGTGGNGGNGGTGGIGAPGAICKSLQASESKITLSSGSAGNGANAGNGGRGGDGGDTTQWGAYCGTKGGGGSGGIPGAGGNGGNVLTTDYHIEKDMSTTVTVTRGSVGLGGNGGSGGTVGAVGHSALKRGAFSSGDDRSSYFGKNGENGNYVSLIS